jgi:hypothetical protein
MHSKMKLTHPIPALQILLAPANEQKTMTEKLEKRKKKETERPKGAQQII